MTRPGLLPVLKFPEDLADEFDTAADDQFAADDAEIKSDEEILTELDAGNDCDNPGGHLYFHGWCLHCDKEAP